MLAFAALSFWAALAGLGLAALAIMPLLPTWRRGSLALAQQPGETTSGVAIAATSAGVDS